jgi:uncharacterized protein
MLWQIIVCYAVLCILVFFLSDQIMYPVPAPYQDAQIEVPIIKLRTPNGHFISALHLPNLNAKYTLLISHGNAENLWMIFPWLKAFQAHGFSVFAYDYQGYGSSSGKPSENNTYQDIQAAYDYLRENLNIPDNRIILFGRSIGTGPTLELARRVKVAGVILESAMLTAFRVVTYWPLFPIDKYRNNAKIVEISTPILFIHGTKDKVIPFWQGKSLYELAKNPKYFYAVEGAGHNDVFEVAGGEYWKTLQTFAAGL